MRSFILFMLMSFVLPFSLSAGNIEKVVTPNMEDKSPMSHFCWGADLGGSIDMSGHDMSTIDIGANFGYKNDYLRLLGIGASLNMMVSNSNRSFPIYGIVRTNFMNRPSLCFFDARAGVSLNYFEDNVSQAGLFLSGGIGFNLALGQKFKSHIILSYNYFDRGYYTRDGVDYNQPDLHLVTMRLGVSF